MKEGTSACALTWLCRFLKMIAVLVQRLEADAATQPANAIWAGYEAALSPHHPWMTRQLVKTGVGAAPTRADFMAKMGVESEAAVAAQLKELCAHFKPTLDAAIALLVARGVEKEAY